jgi:hypothetical protein
MPRENLFAFSARRVREMVGTYVPMVRLLWTIDRLRRRVEHDPMSRSYSDLAIAPVSGAHDEDLELYQRSDAARQAAAKAKVRADRLRAATHAAAKAEGSAEPELSSDELGSTPRPAVNA